MSTFKSISHSGHTESVSENITMDLSALAAEMKAMRMCLERRSVVEPPVMTVRAPDVYVTVPEVTIPPTIIPPWPPWPEFKAVIESNSKVAEIPWNKILWVTGGLWAASLASAIIAHALHFI